jgi:hypothetical protein
MATVLERQIADGAPAAPAARAKKTWKQKILHEIRVVAIATLYFLVCFGFLMLFKHLTLAQYKIDFQGFGMAIFAALLAGKVVIVLEKIPLGGWTRSQPAVIEVLLRTAIYVLGAFAVLMLEQGFHARHEAGGWMAGVVHVLKTRDRDQMIASTMGVGVAMLIFNLYVVLHRYLGTWPLLRLFFGRPTSDQPMESSHS